MLQADRYAVVLFCSYDYLNQASQKNKLR